MTALSLNGWLVIQVANSGNEHLPVQSQLRVMRAESKLIPDVHF